MTGKRRAEPAAGGRRGRRAAGRGTSDSDELGVPARTPAAPPPLSFNAPPPDSMVIQPQATRREARAARKREQRKKFGLVGGGAAVVIGIVIAIVVALGVSKVVTDNGGSKRSQTTLLFQLQGLDGSAAGSMLLAHDPKHGGGVEVMVQPRLITDVCGYGPHNFGEVLGLPGGQTASVRAISAVLNGVTVDGSWVVTGAQLAKLINTVGGLTLNVDQNVIRHERHGRNVIVVPAGPSVHVTGPQAVDYAVYQTNIQQGAAAQLLRLQLVVDGLVRKLPPTVNGIAALIRPLGKTAASSIGVTRLATLLHGLALDDRAQNAMYATDLPATPIDAGGPAPSYRPDDSATGIKLLVDKYLDNSVSKSVNSQHATVEVLNGVGLPGLVQTACPRLLRAGFTYAGEGDTPDFNHPRSEVLAYSDNDVDQAYALAKALGLPRSDVAIGTLNQNIAKYVVILGRDYPGLSK